MALAPRLNAEILCVDSMQIYRGMDIGTAKPTAGQRRRVPHHLIDIVEASEHFSAARFVKLADAAITDIQSRSRRVLIVAGTPLYLMGLMYGLFDGPSADASFRSELRDRASKEGIAALHAELAAVDPDAAARIHPNDLKRIERGLEVYRLTGTPLSALQSQWAAGVMRYPAAVVGIRRDRAETSRRINARVKQMIADGFVDEVRGLLAAPGGMGEQARQALGYAEIIAHLEGGMSLDDAVERIKIQTRRFAKHQRTWFRKFPAARWVDLATHPSCTDAADRLWALATSTRAS